jgi:anti-sigma factor RsiW
MAPTDDLDWLAHRYLLDELSADEAAAFEEQLGTDEEAAAALARSTRLMAAVGSALHDAKRPEPPPGTSVPRQKFLVGLTAIAATIALVCGLSVSQALKPVAASGDAAELVSIWRESAGEMPVESDALAVEDEVQAATDDVPDWLMAAVALDVPETDDEILEN